MRILGSGLVDVERVRFGGTGAPDFTESSKGTTVVVVAPAHRIGMVSVTVKTPGGEIGNIQWR